MSEEGKKSSAAMEKIRAVKWNKDTFLILILVGILLFIIALPMENRKPVTTSKKASSKIENKETDMTENGSENDNANESSMEMQYARELEVKLQETLQYMEGVGKVKVMITLRSSEEEIIEKDNTNTRSGSTEQDSAGGSRNSNEMSNETVTIYEEDENGIQKPYVVKKILPSIEGIIVIAQGGNNLTTNKNITEAIQSLFGIEVHKIKVVKMKS